MTAEAGDIKQLCQMTGSETGKEPWEPRISGVLCHRRVYMGIGVGMGVGGGWEVRCMWEKEKKKMRSGKKGEGDGLGKWSVGLRMWVKNWKVCAGKMRWRRRNGRQMWQRGEERNGELKWNIIGYQEGGEMFVTCVNSRAHSMSASKRKATVTRRNISSFKVHLTRQLFVFPPADAAHHLTAASHHSSNRVLDPPPLRWQAVHGFNVCCWPHLTPVFWDSGLSCILGAALGTVSLWSPPPLSLVSTPSPPSQKLSVLALID